MGLQTGVGIDVIYKTTQHVHISHLCCFANQGFRAVEEKGRPYQVDVPSTMALTKHHWQLMGNTQGLTQSFLWKKSSNVWLLPN